MSRNRGKNTRPEVLFRKALWSKGFRYRLKNNVFGKPDIFLKGYNIVIFIDGCFWHGCPKHYVSPKTNKSYWKKKLIDNKARDKKVTDVLIAKGYIVIRLWEHEINEKLDDCVNFIMEISGK